MSFCELWFCRCVVVCLFVDLTQRRWARRSGSPDRTNRQMVAATEEPMATLVSSLAHLFFGFKCQVWLPNTRRPSTLTSTHLTGVYFGENFTLAGQEFQTMTPESFLFGDMSDLNFLAQVSGTVSCLTCFVLVLLLF